MPEEKKVPVPEHLQSLVTPPEPTLEKQDQKGSQEQDKSQQNDEASKTASPDIQAQILEVMQAQAKYLEAMKGQMKQMSEERASGRQYISELEQRGPAASSQQGVDYDVMSNQELVQHMNEKHSEDLANMARQFGELVEVVVPGWEGWKSTRRNAMYGLMSRGFGPKQANDILTQATQDSTPTSPTNETSVTKDKDADFKAAVETRVQEVVTQQRSNKAGITGKPARNDAMAPALTHRELNKQLHAKLMSGETIPESARGTPG